MTGSRPRALVIVDARVPDDGAYTGSEQPVEVGFGRDGDDHAVEVLARVLDPATLLY